ncbi:sulfotransferase family protein [Subsaxibacter sp. CAU 1640]|uniref:sulfotransferase family 2 domain-containing protein n=1 Tax=Subsaxibacter sp. CAU 1640 TaxID=2933271 RepID=UPI002006A7DB|nr:sulfotransferase family 2 domain-containing protein [Subsaxibacter sp. CAU 1640]MCK7591244.1 sulfotransferase family protein [Subsaxibacter sp. CAU 1640]
MKKTPAQQQVGPITLGTELLLSKGDNIKGIFMHIHKCAGTSLIEAFEHHPAVVSCVARPGNFPNRTGRELIPDTIWNDSLKFTFVRNPYARIVSAYLMFTRGSKWGKIFPQFEDFVMYLKWSDVHGHTVPYEVPTDVYVKGIDNILHHCSGFTNPKYRLNEMDYIGKIETMQEDLQQIATLLNIDMTALPHKNKSKNSYNYQDFYTDHTKNIIGDLYKEDIERFGYEF